MAAAINSKTPASALYMIRILQNMTIDNRNNYG